MSDFFDRVQAYAQTLQPALSLAYLRALRELATGFKETAVAEAIGRGDIAGAADLIASDVEVAVAMLPVRDALREALLRAAVYFFRDTPKGPPSPTRLTTIVRFDAHAAPVGDAAVAFEQPVLDQIATDIRAGIRASITDALEAGTAPRTIARELRNAIGLTDAQAKSAGLYEQELVALSRSALARELTDGRIDRMVAKAITARTPLSADQIDRAVTTYVRNLRAHQAATIARTNALNAMKEGQRLAWMQAVAQGRVNANDLIDEWHTRMDGRQRHTHALMNGRTKRFLDPWDVPGVGYQDYPGQDEFNCRCVAFTRPRTRRASEIAAANSAPVPIPQQIAAD